MNDEPPESPSKRRKLASSLVKSEGNGASHPTSDLQSQVGYMSPQSRMASAQNRQSDLLGSRGTREDEVGITQYVNAASIGFTGILKKRYTDFMVNEILPSGQVVHLNDVRIPKTAKSEPKAQAESPSTASIEVSRENGNASPTSKQGADHVPLPGLGDSVSAKPTATREEEQNPGQISENDKTLLISYFGDEVTKAILTLHAKIIAAPNAKTKSFDTVQTKAIADRQLRTTMHKEMRRIFLSKLETTTNGEGVMNISCQSKGNAWGQTDRRGASTTNPLSTRMTWQDRGGEHLHFTVYKENKDTMEIVSFICRQLKLPAKNLQFAGTKDRRAVTSQRVSAYRVAADRIAGLNRTLRNSKVGDFEYKPYGLELGDLQGNEFVITLRDCRVADSTTSDLERLRETVQGRVSKIADNGFINYYGLQRFGSFSIRTDTVGLMMLKGDFKGACDALLEYSPEALEAALDPMSGINNEKNISSDDKARAHAIYAFQKRGKGHQALRDLPRKFSAEMAIIRHLSNEQRANDFQSALQSVPRNLRLMYVHAYQSLIWNVAASKRWGMHGSKVVEGDLILVENQKKEADADGDAPEEVDESGEVVIHPAGGDSAALEAKRFERARPLSQEEAESGKHTIFDIVLPTPGFDVLYPSNDLGDFYKTYMAGDEGGGLDPHRMRRSWKDISLSGNYRKVLSRPLNGGKVEFELKEYVDDNEQMVPTDLDILEKRQAGKGKSTEASGLSGSNGNEERIDEEEVQQKKPAVILKFQLGSSQYATMILRELMGRDAVHVYKPDFGGAR